MKKTVFFLLGLIIVFSCEKNDETIKTTDNLLIGNWINPVYNDGVVTFSRAKLLQKEAAGFSFEEDDMFIERTSGFCGTPPLTFFDKKGTWNLTDDVLKIYDIYIPAVVGAEPVLLYNYKVINITETSLILKK